MGLTHTLATVETLDRTGSPLEVRFLVETGAIDCLMPASILHRAGIRPEGSAIYELADGRTVELAFGRARIQLLDTVAVARIIFGSEEAEPLLGAIALEDAGVTVDPATQTLKKITVRSLKRAA